VFAVPPRAGGFGGRFGDGTRLAPLLTLSAPGGVTFALGFKSSPLVFFTCGCCEDGKGCFVWLLDDVARAGGTGRVTRLIFDATDAFDQPAKGSTGATILGFATGVVFMAVGFDALGAAGDD